MAIASSLAIRRPLGVSQQGQFGCSADSAVDGREGTAPRTLTGSALLASSEFLAAIECRELSFDT